MPHSSEPYFDKRGDYAISISTAKMPFIAAGLVNSALATLLSELSTRFFQLAILPEKSEADERTRLISRDSVQSAIHPPSLSTIITAPTNNLINPEPLDETRLTTGTAVSESSAPTSTEAFKLEDSESNGDHMCSEVQTIYSAEFFTDTTLHSGSSSITPNNKLHSEDSSPSTDSPQRRRKRASRSPTMLPCTYPNCGRTFVRLALLNAHVKFHTDERPFACEFPGCDGRFRDKHGLRCHKQVHLDERSRRYIYCTYPGCDRKFLKISCAQGHLNNHLGLKPYECEYPGCFQSFTRCSVLVRHRKLHCPRKVRQKITCPHPGCDRTFLHRASLRDHQYAHLQKPNFSCDYPGCTKTYYRPSRLKHHQEKHKPNPKTRRFRCKYAGCDAEFSHNGLLANHTHVSHGRPKLVCQFPDCVKEFTIEDNRRSHYRTHLKWLHENEPIRDAESVLAQYPFLPTTLRRRVSELFTVTNAEPCGSL